MKKTRSPRRDLNGILLLDKPLHFSSNDAVQKSKNVLRARKAGHSGSLDPLATGMLPLCFGEATKFSQFLLDADKAYDVTAKLGIKTASGDVDSDIISERLVPSLDADLLESVIAKFRGAQQQIPSMYSALKHKGQPLYKLARQGIEVERPAREIMIYALMLEAFTADTITLSVRCSKGTYIRTLIEDIGEALGCGAHVTALRRPYVSPFEGMPLVSIDELNEDTPLLKVESALANLPAIHLTSSNAFYIRNGQAVRVADAPENGIVTLFDADQVFIGIGHMLDDGRVAPQRLVSTAQRSAA